MFIHANQTLKTTLQAIVIIKKFVVALFLFLGLFANWTVLTGVILNTGQDQTLIEQEPLSVSAKPNSFGCVLTALNQIIVLLRRFLKLEN